MLRNISEIFPLVIGTSSALIYLQNDVWKRMYRGNPYLEYMYFPKCFLQIPHTACSL
jgi:hypothetical protein